MNENVEETLKLFEKAVEQLKIPTTDVEADNEAELQAIWNDLDRKYKLAFCLQDTLKVKQRHVRNQLAIFCKSKGHTYHKVCHNASGHGHYWNCKRCGHGASGRHSKRPDPFYQ